MTLRVTLVITMPMELLYGVDVEHVYKGRYSRNGMIEGFKKYELPDTIRAREIITATIMSFYARTSPASARYLNPMRFDARRGAATFMATRILEAGKIDALKKDMDRRDDELIKAVKRLEDIRTMSVQACHVFGIDYRFAPNEKGEE